MASAAVFTYRLRRRPNRCKSREGRCVPVAVTPDRMRSSLPFFGIPLPFTQLFRQMVKQLTVAAVNGGMVRYRSTKAAQQNIARLCRGQGHPVKAGDRHIVQVQVLAVAPPVILAMKIRHINSRQMVCIPEQRVTVRHPCSKRRPVRCGTQRNL